MSAVIFNRKQYFTESRPNLAGLRILSRNKTIPGRISYQYLKQKVTVAIASQIRKPYDQYKT